MIQLEILVLQLEGEVGCTTSLQEQPTMQPSVLSSACFDHELYFVRGREHKTGKECTVVYAMKYHTAYD